MAQTDAVTNQLTKQEGQTFKVEFSYKKQELSGPKEFFQKILGKLKTKDVVSVGEMHDENQDTSYSWITQYEAEILNAFNWYHAIQNSPKGGERLPRLDQILDPNSRLLADLEDQGQNNTFEALQKMHPGKLFGVAILPAAKMLGYTDVVLEGLDESGPSNSLNRSKDRNGDLLRIVSAMASGMRIHGAYAGSLLDSGADVAKSLIDKAKSVKDKYGSNAKVIIYNGAIHNATDLNSDDVVSEGFSSYKVSQLSYAPEAIALWGDKYGSIDIFNQNAKLPETVYSKMQEDTKPGQVVEFEHGIDQQTYFI